MVRLRFAAHFPGLTGSNIWRRQRLLPEAFISSNLSQHVSALQERSYDRGAHDWGAELPARRWLFCSRAERAVVLIDKDAHSQGKLCGEFLTKLMLRVHPSVTGEGGVMAATTFGEFADASCPVLSLIKAP